MAKGVITSFRVEAADNGFTLNYCIKTKHAPSAGQTYANTDYKDVTKVFGTTEAKSLLDELSDLLGVVDTDSDESSEEDMPVMAKES